MSKDISVYEEKVDAIRERKDFFIQATNRVINSTNISDRQAKSASSLVESEIYEIVGEVLGKLRDYLKQEIEKQEYFNAIVNIFKFYSGRILTIIESLGLEKEKPVKDVILSKIWKYCDEMIYAAIGGHNFKKNPF